MAETSPVLESPDSLRPGFPFHATTVQLRSLRPDSRLCDLRIGQVPVPYVAAGMEIEPFCDLGSQEASVAPEFIPTGRLALPRLRLAPGCRYPIETRQVR